MTTDRSGMSLDEPAFPIYGEVAGYQYTGIGIRDYFAAHAPDMPSDWWGGERSRKALIAWRWAYADDMLKIRKEQGR